MQDLSVVLTLGLMKQLHLMVEMYPTKIDREPRFSQYQQIILTRGIKVVNCTQKKKYLTLLNTEIYLAIKCADAGYKKIM